MGIFAWFRRKDSKDDDFENILAGLETDIREHEEALTFIVQRERRAVLLLTIYSVLAWLVYVLAWYFGALEAWNGDLELQNEGSQILERAFKTLPVGAIPVLIFFTRRIVKWFYRRKQAYENKELARLRKKQKDQIEKLKKLSNYDKITEMLERHGQLPPRAPQNPFGTPQASSKSRPGTPQGTPSSIKTQSGNLTPAQQAILARNLQQQGPGKRSFPAPPPGFGRPGPPMTPVRGGQAASLNMQVPNDAFGGAPPQPRGLIDKLADALLGGDTEESPASKYALICQKCFAHNGLVLKDEIMDIQFVCPKCGAFNPSRRARMTGDQASLAAQPIVRESRSSITASEEGDDSVGPISPTLPSSSGAGVGSELSTSQAPNRDSDSGEEHAEPEIADVPSKKGDERKANLRNRTAGRSGPSGDSMDTDE